MMLQSVNSISTTIESSSSRLPPGEVTTRVVTASCDCCQVGRIGARPFCLTSVLPENESALLAMNTHRRAAPTADAAAQCLYLHRHSYRARTTSFFVQACTCRQCGQVSL